MADRQKQVRQDKSEVPPDQEQHRQSGSNRGSFGERRKHSGDRSRDENDWRRNQGRDGSSDERRKDSGERSRDEKDWPKNQGRDGSNDRQNKQNRQQGHYRQNNDNRYYNQNRQAYSQNYEKQNNRDFNAPRGGRGFGRGQSYPRGRGQMDPLGYHGRGLPYHGGVGQMDPLGCYGRGQPYPGGWGQVDPLGYHGRDQPYPGGGGQMGHYMPAQSSQEQQYNSEYINQGRRKREDDDVVFLSKTLSYILRHGAEKQGFQLMKGGFLYVDEILRRTQKLHGFTSDDIEMVVQTNDKQRFALEKDERGRLKIRANQGHTMEVEDLDLEEITSSAECPAVIHGTYYSSWEIIKNSGLSRMGRNHVHFAAGEPGENGVISGMRKTCDVLIFVDLEKALQDGLKFYRSANNVILCPGDDKGIIYPCYFSDVVTRNPRHKLDFDNTITKVTVKSEPAAKASKYSGQSKEKSENRPVGLPEQKERGKTKKKKKRKNKDKETNEAETAHNDDSIDVDVKQLAKKIAPEEQHEVPENWDIVDETHNTGERETNLLESDAGVCQGDNKSEFEDSCDKLDETHKMETEECCPNTNTEETESDYLPVLESPPPDTLKEASSQTNCAEAAAVADKDITIIADADHSKSVVEHFLEEATPDAMAVCCYGDNLGTEKSKIQLLVLVTDDQAYAYRLKDDDGSIIKDGSVKRLFNDPRINKVFNGIKPQSLSMIHEWGILLDGTPIWDLTILYDKLSKVLSKNIINEMESTVLDPSDWTDGDITSGIASTELNKDVQLKVLKRGRDMLTLYRHFGLHKNQMRDVKSHMYEAASPKDGFMAEKILELKEQKKMEAKQKKREEKIQQSKQQTSPNKKGNKKKK